ncbi:Nramp family divalent metal transporter [Streptomyces anulatus]|uniref:Nramp family divalent metal transporter n=1 Tax=Streptomyces anulatus TaxID=1892 RepID=UPI002256E239|nr:Nramp family divalent metal transporter [Streptomyces anulatus]MCX4488936.1 Nramp family divalent metal transporter [Streptomyces anulatus]WSI80021.1 Nramp family divalent metal transporter [Streptomyces anulatus]WTD12347.1 Nramp family divalent metal transporter [Streptomyces anulatus]WTD25634.1 Nramp family divalent metal transporter [Streptomyces anulatus]WTE05658.1 Nramp family divalent metal transporter [Streptomyces anulatus]
MAETSATTGTGEPASRPRQSSWKYIGPGIVVAATGVGAGDLVATLIAGSKFGYTLMWAAVIGCVVKISLAEAAGRWHLATGRTLFDGWRSLGPWTTVYFAVYVVLWGFIYGATAMSSSALPIVALFPEGPGLKFWAIVTGLIGLAFVWFNRYAVFEKVMTVLIGIMFVVVVYVAARVVPDVGASFAGLLPVLPDGSLLYTLGLIGGVGGTITMAAYGYWVNAKGWSNSSWMKVMRLDNRVAYITTGIFVVAMLIVGAELLHASQVALTSGDRGLIDLGKVLEDRFGAGTAKLFLVGFFATSFSSLIGVWHGVSLMFADFVERFRAPAAGAVKTEEHEGADVAERRQRSLPFRAYLLWLTFPPMTLLWLDEPFGLVIAYGVLGAFFMPFLALTLLWLLNSSRTPGEWRNGWVSNGMLALSGLLFVVLCVQQVRELPW